MAGDKIFVLDTSALLTLREDGLGSDEVEARILQAQKQQCRLLVSFMTRMEILYLVRREENETAAHETLRLIDSFPIEWISCELEILEGASLLKSGGGLSVADSWIAATALVHQATLVHKDPEFSKLKNIPQQILGR
ncbi:MAG TPA: PIN domain-containing protein [Acidobacteriota bacterium]|jgi:ribonuclease VapC|nr:PIN domain-containing protein [Acidobacteriota bacterium]